MDIRTHFDGEYYYAWLGDFGNTKEEAAFYGALISQELTLENAILALQKLEGLD